MSRAVKPAISRWVLSITYRPTILRDVGVTPNMSHPPSAFKRAQAVCIASFISPVVFFNDARHSVSRFSVLLL